MSFEDNSEQRGNQAEVPAQIIEQIREALATHVEEVVTDPEHPGLAFLLNVPADIRDGKPTQGYSGKHLDINGRLVMLGQRFHLTPNQIDTLRGIIFK